MFTLILLIVLIVIVIASFYISTYLYENDITLIALSVVLVGILLSVVTGGFIMYGVIDFISQYLEIFYSESKESIMIIENDECVRTYPSDKAFTDKEKE